jgi:hypothetical protein
MVIAGKEKYYFLCVPLRDTLPVLANFVGIVVGFLNVLVIRLRSLLLAAALSFECKSV